MLASAKYYWVCKLRFDSVSVKGPGTGFMEKSRQSAGALVKYIIISKQPGQRCPPVDRPLCRPVQLVLTESKQTVRPSNPLQRTFKSGFQFLDMCVSHAYHLLSALNSKGKIVDNVIVCGASHLFFWSEPLYFWLSWYRNQENVCMHL